MSLETALRSHLAGKTEITAVCSNRILFGEVDASREQLPQIVFTIDDHDFASTLDTPVDLHMPLCAFEIRADDPEHIDTLSDLVRRSLLELEDGATIGSESVECLTMIDGGSDETPITMRDDDDTVRVLRRLVMAEIGYRYTLTAVT